MTRARRLLTLGLFAASVVQSAPAAAHRLDEYLQASRISVDPDRIAIEIDLTPGVRMAPAMRGWIDLDGDGTITTREEEAYAREIVAGLSLAVDGHPAAIRLIDAQFPDASSFDQGVGTVHLRTEAVMPVAGSGRHQLSYVNMHQPQASVYLVNALVPADARVRISGQERDPAQHRLTLDYEVTYSAWPRAASLAAGLAGIGVVIAARRRAVSGRPAQDASRPS